MASSPLTRSQREVAKLALAVLEPDGFALAGGAALVASGITRRPTRDLDAFTDRHADIGAAAERVALALGQAGFEVELLRGDPGFARLQVTAPGHRRSQVAIDLGRDHIAWPVSRTALGATLSVRELAANKVLALFGRVQPRDLADLADLAARFEVDAMLADARSKDAGLDLEVLAEMVELVMRRPDAEWPEGADVMAVRAFGGALVAHLRRPPG